MDLTEARRIVREQPRAVLATTRTDGSPQMSPVLAGVAEDGAILISSRATAFKVKNLRRDPRIWLCVLPDAFFGRWIQIEGTATVVDLPEAMPGLEDYYRRVTGEHPDWAEYRATMESERRVLIRVELTRAGPDRSG
ncbi:MULTISPECIES: PPOX class F420-dependent oxidoreductase [unclassified Crossiella]|uniref:PPOX class F420-dependent oxidoreductase n=1 Tax=unclassified Crossiella TaxID=2620835 RepID=UPI0020003DE5|nr:MULTISPECIES: PPOX class F420-dependent oxidoreductase [unclassified Crossiella]MCK2240212.1 PPOX class F420-dependent oxidoreductase [Crossiella sp. S99.2]MCK2253336.1 PPOX class F420-dependent oxidoreductase [Crossiella sp. S99.1]